jgi:hypothetical protein
MQQVAFRRGFNLGADMFKARILNATAGMEYEPEDNSDLEGLGYEADAKLLDGQPVEIALSDSGSVDAMSESSLGTDPVPYATPPVTATDHAYLGPVGSFTTPEVSA